jgi:DNA-binding CsgD family transcriptional regulator
MQVGTAANKRHIGIKGKAIEILPNGTMLLQLSVMKDIGSLIKEKGRFWSEIIVNELDVYHFHEESRSVNKGSLLSQRELEVLYLIKKGNSSKETADKLFISMQTVETHRKNMLQKTACKDVSSLLNVYDFGNLWPKDEFPDLR